MLRAIRKRLHLTPSTVIASLALVFAMSGGAYAAGKYVITSTKQISPKVLKSLTGKAGVAGKAGANGANGATGATGPAGPAGAGTPGATGKEGAAGKEGKEGKEGPPGTTGFTATLPAKSTETGTWTAQSASNNASLDNAFTAVSFPIPLKAALTSEHVIFVEPESTSHETECPGTFEKPAAAAGDLCVYAAHLGGMTPSVSGPGPIANPSSTFKITEPGAAGASATGAIVMLTPESEEIETAYGTWAVTAAS